MLYYRVGYFMLNGAEITIMSVEISFSLLYYLHLSTLKFKNVRERTWKIKKREEEKEETQQKKNGALLHWFPLKPLLFLFLWLPPHRLPNPWSCWAYPGPTLIKLVNVFGKIYLKDNKWFESEDKRTNLLNVELSLYL